MDQEPESRQSKQQPEPIYRAKRRVRNRAVLPQAPS